MNEIIFSKNENIKSATNKDINVAEKYNLHHFLIHFFLFIQPDFKLLGSDIIYP